MKKKKKIKMKKRKILLAIIPALALVNFVSLAKSNNGFDFRERDPDSWQMVADGADGKIKIDDNNFTFTASGLSEADYTLVKYTGIWPGNPVVCLAEGHASKKGGILNLSGKYLDAGPQVWLVLSSDVDCQSQKMLFWNPTEYLFDYSVTEKPGGLP